jgi:mevalonate kinase
MFFEANIPTGYGLGSSGAFCAAVYHRYVSKPETDLVALKKQLAAMECFFHGSSSGIDPLTSYLGLPVMIQHANQVTLATQKPWMNNQPVVFLVDSTLPRKSQTLIDWFLQSSQTESFQALLQEKYLPTHETLIQSWLEADTDTFWPKIQAVSAFQREHFAPMVPATVQKIWEEGLATNQFTLKICGAGGGGFVLGFAKNQEALRTLLPTFRIYFPFSAG